jgi:glycosyltransferase involved in cell wall biosynthesis
MARQFDDEWTNVLFVGRVIPNKRIENVIRAFAAYKARHNHRSRLLIVGSYGGFERYLAMLEQLVARLGVPDVHFSGHVSNEELTAYYDVADVFLCASEHEGFCVPLIEAFYKRIPVLALARTAVPATMDGAGVLYADPDPADVAALVDVVVGDADVQERILAGQDAALDRLRRRDFGGTLLRFVDQALASPRRPEHRVAWDFWQQFDTTERLEAQRLFRPSLYKALPTAARASGINW